MAGHEIIFLSRKEVEALNLAFGDIMAEVELGLKCHGSGQTVMPPKAYLDLEDIYKGHFNILRGYVGPIEMAGVKVIGDYVDNYKKDYPSEFALLNLYDPRYGLPLAIMDATVLTWLRTGAVTAIGAKYLARRDSKIVGHVGARGTAGSNIRAIASLFDIEEIRITSKRRESREELAEELRRELSVPVTGIDTIEETVRGADIVVEATRLEEPQLLLRKEWLKPGSLLVTYGWVMALDPELPFEMDKIVVDDWEQCKGGGQLYPLIKEGRLSDKHIHAEIGQICAGLKQGRTSDRERILFWHRGFAISDVMIGNLAMKKARDSGIGQRLSYF